MGAAAVQAEDSRSLLLDLQDNDSLLLMLPGKAGERNVVQVTFLHKSGRRARLRVVAGADVMIHRSAAPLDK